MNAPDWYCAWAKRHCSIFSLLGPEEIATVGAWFDVFVAAGYTEANLHEATTKLALQPEIFASEDVRYRSKMFSHLLAIRTCIQNRKAVAYRKAVENKDWGTCTLCGNTGLVVVPALRSIVDGQWRPIRFAQGGTSSYTEAVACRCALGNHRRGHMKAKFQGEERNLMTLEQYEARNPRWQVQMIQRQKELSELGALGPKHEKYDASLNKLAKNNGKRKATDG